MVIHPDGRIEGTPEELARYRRALGEDPPEGTALAPLPKGPYNPWNPFMPQFPPPYTYPYWVYTPQYWIHLPNTVSVGNTLTITPQDATSYPDTPSH